MPVLFILVGVLCGFPMLPDVYILLSSQEKRYTLLSEGTDVHIWQYFYQKHLKLLSAIILLCLGNKSKKQDCKIIALSLVALE